LWIADPKAINHILQKSGYLYAKPGTAQEGIVFGHGIVWAEGELSTIVGHSLLLAHLMTPQVTYTSVTEGRWLRPLVLSRLKLCYPISWTLLPRHVSFISI